MSTITKKLFQETTARIVARNAEPINPIQLTLDGHITDQLTSQQRQLLNPANFILPEAPVKSELAEAWETTLVAWRSAWDGSIWRTVQDAQFSDIVNLDAISHSWRDSDNRPAKSVGTARIELQQEMHKLQEAIDKANALTIDLQQLEMAGARAEFEDWQTKARLYHWHIKSHVEGLEGQAKRDEQLVTNYLAQQATKAMNRLHMEAFNENWERTYFPEKFVTASA
jgi:hypothetical protein